MSSFFEKPGLSHIGSKILFSLDFVNQANCRQVCRLWNQIIEELFSKMILKISLEHLKVLLDKFSERRSLKPFEKASWNRFIMSSFELFGDSNSNKYFELYMNHVLSTTRQRNWFRDYTPTHEFVFLGNIKMVKFILSNGLHSFNANDWTILHEAIEFGQLEIVKYLVVGGYFSKFKALHVASKCGNLEIIKMLAPNPKHIGHFSCGLLLPNHIELEGDSVKLDNYGNNPIHTAATEGHIAIVEYFIQNVDGLNATDKEGNTALHLALKNSEFEIVKLIAENVDQECIEISDDEDRNVIHTAALNGEVECLKLLCQKTDKINLKVHSDGNTPLHYAAEYGHLDCIQVLMEFKSIRDMVGVCRNRDMFTPVELAQKYNHHEIVDYLKSCIDKKRKLI